MRIHETNDLDFRSMFYDLVEKYQALENELKKKDITIAQLVGEVHGMKKEKRNE